MTNTKTKDEVLRQIEELRQDAKGSKYRHFAASERYLRYHNICGTVTLLLEIVVAGVLLYALVEIPESKLLRLLVAVVALMVIFLTGFQTRFGFDQRSGRHRTVANRYLATSLKCKRLLGQGTDLGLTPDDLWAAFDSQRDEYMLINQESDECPTSRADDRKALNNLKNPRTPFGSLES